MLADRRDKLKYIQELTDRSESLGTREEERWQQVADACQFLLVFARLAYDLIVFMTGDGSRPCLVFEICFFVALQMKKKHNVEIKSLKDL